MTMGIDLHGPFDYTFAAIPAKYPSEYLKFFEADFVLINGTLSFFMPRVTKVGGGKNRDETVK